MMNSEERAYKNKITELQDEKKTIAGVVLREVTAIINQAEFLSEEHKESLLKEVWKGRN